MLSIRLLTAGAEEYYANLAAEDYYLEGGEPPGKWEGSGATAMGLTGTVDPKAFRSLFRGYHHATGVPLVQNAGYSDRQCGWDFTFSAPKSVSIVWSVVSVVVRLLIQKFQQLAVAATLRYAEENLVFSRAGKGGVDSCSVGLVTACYEHGTNRLLQAQLHTHAIIMNLGVAADGKTRAIYSKLMFRYKKVLGAYYRAYLANLLETELGFRLIRKSDSFEIDGVPEDLINLHSQRRAQILAYLDENGKDRNDAIAAADAALKTRRTKKDIPPRAKLLQRWQEVNQSHGFSEASVAALPRPQSRNPADDLSQALASAQDRMADRCSHFTMKEFLFEVLLEAPKWGLSPESIPQAVHDYLATAADIITLRPIDGETRYTTRTILKQEARLLRLTTDLRRGPGCRSDYHRVEKTLLRSPTLRDEQARAVRYLTRGKGRLRILCGKAGTGKTTALRVAHKIWVKQGYRVVGMTYTGKAATVLQDSTGIPTDTIHRQMADFKVSPKRAAKHHFKQAIRALQGKRTYRLGKPKPVKIDAKTIVVVDEAGMVNTRHMRMIMKLVQKGGGTLVLLGDPNQLPPVEGGAPFLSISRRAGFTELTEICRQEEEWARDAVRLFSDGKPGEALRLFAEHNLLTVREDRAEAVNALVRDWTAVGLTTPEQATVLVATNSESESVNNLCQARRLAAGCLDARYSLEIRDEDPTKGIAYVNRVHVGDRILFTRNNRRYGVENGAVGTVMAFGGSLFRKSIAVKLDDGRRAVIPVKQFPHMRLGYAMTTHKAQGVTVPETFILAGGPMQNLPISYVQASRARRQTHFYTEKALLDELLENIEDSPLAKQMADAPELTLATDLLTDAAGIHGPITPLPELPAAPSPPETTPSHRKRPTRQRRRRRKPVQAGSLDLTYGMAQVEAMERRRRVSNPASPAAEASGGLSPAKPDAGAEEPQHSFLAMQYLETDAADSSDDLDTATGLPIELVLDAHFVDAAVQAEVQHCEEEELRLVQERLDELRRQREAAEQQQALAQAAEAASWQSGTIYASAASGSSSSPYSLGQSSSTIGVSSAAASSTFDQQSYLTTGAAQTQWTQHNQESTTTAIVPR